MKITRSELQKLINEEITQSNSVLLEMPAGSLEGKAMGALGDTMDSNKVADIDHTAQALFHIMNQAQTLHAMMSGDSTPPIDDHDRKTIEAAYKALDRVFKTMSHRHASTGVQE